MDSSILERIRGAVRDGKYRFSDHALEELDADSLHPIDAEAALLAGRLARVQPDEPQAPGPRYTVVGTATDLMTKLTVVCRFDVEESLLIITAYEGYR